MIIRPEFAVDARQALAEIRQLRRNLPERLAEHMQSIVGSSMSIMVPKIPTDTNRLRNSWAQAGTMAGVGRWPLMPLRPSRVGYVFEEVLDKQVREAERVLRHLEATGQAYYKSDRKKAGKKSYQVIGAPTKTYLKWQKALRRAKEEVAKFKEGSLRTLDGGISSGDYQQTAVVMFNKNRLGFKSFASVRQKVYGGVGQTVITRGAGGPGVAVRLGSLEPHAKFIEKRKGLVRDMVARCKVFGATKIPNKLLKIA